MLGTGTQEVSLPEYTVTLSDLHVKISIPVRLYEALRASAITTSTCAIILFLCTGERHQSRSIRAQLCYNTLIQANCRRGNVDRVSLIQVSQQLFQQALDLLFPPRCAACQRSGAILCPACLAAIRPLLPPYCAHCNTPLEASGSCRYCSHRLLRLSGLRVVSRYEGILRASIHALKYAGNRRVAAPLGSLLAQAYSIYGLRADIMIPVPLHYERLQQRGYNQACLLAQACSRQLGIPVNSTLIVRTRSTTSQVHLDMKERHSNVAGAFCCQPGAATETVRGRSILLIDDVCTTGATLEACAVPLFAAGAQAVWGLVLARPLQGIALSR
jgi:ComF family protein